ncbi:hypothetical protein QCA50_003045 [Cerrena zonata]|uniref:Transmembrane protein n=1 Tax=Cerrena zonata TaxID=2478898 RepID=A0AAW0GU31_9APHY
MAHTSTESEKTKAKSKEGSKTRKTKQKTRPVNFAEESHKDSNDDKEKSSKASNKKDGDEKSKPDTKDKSKDRKPIPEIDADAIPNRHYLVLGCFLCRLHTSGSTPIATVLGVAATSVLSSAIPSSTSPILNAASAPDHSPSSKHPSTVVIIVLSIVAAFILFGLIAACWVYTRPKKRTTPTPSLPILQDEYMDEKVSVDEESLFGGKERVSAQPGTGPVLYNWTPYPHTSVIQPKTTDTAKRMSTRQSLHPDDKSSYPFKGQGTVASPSPASSPPLQQLHSAVSRAVNRVSALSASIYPVSPQPSHGYSGIGLAIGGDNSPLTADGTSMLQRNPSKASARRQSRTPKAARQSIAGFDMLTGPINDTDYFIPTRPPPATSIPASSSGGRARVQGPYTSTTSMRTSASVGGLASSRFSMSDRGGNPFESSQYVLPPLPSASKTSESRERDTRALTSALGLETPPLPVSPPTTLYPDDSITLAGDRRRSRAFSHSRMRSQGQALSPTVDATARLGNLMLETFQSSLSLNPSSQPPTGGLPPRPKPAIKKRADDKPPRVPSPPPMPSLAQMAMEHANPGDFADYRSPTYSIYGFYESDRKSTADRRSKMAF